MKLQYGQSAERLAIERGMAEQAQSYTAYGYSLKRPIPSLGFNGEWLGSILQAYALGNGHRFYSPILMRFFCQEGFSPFGHGGLNAYCYCEGDPINYSDPSGQMKKLKTGLTAEFERTGIPKAFKRAVRNHFEQSSEPYSLGMGNAGYKISRGLDGRFTVAEIPGLGATRKQLERSQTENARLRELNQALHDRLDELEVQRSLPKPLRPLPPSPPPPPRPPKGVCPAPDPTQIRQPSQFGN
ncbi:RHS repeat-associated core domain-containing protein [Pseudomonas sp. S1(2024)]|uniref:RHS repeat-associated core domain-containing protein n=1 Tax=Pseudomonas sp. S1(2024) TaxID=3390191 RepID=UPI003978EB65